MLKQKMLLPGSKKIQMLRELLFSSTEKKEVCSTESVLLSPS